MANQWVLMLRGKYQGKMVPVRKGPPEMRPAGIRVGAPRVNPGGAEDKNALVPKYLVTHPEVIGLPASYPCWVRAEECRLLPEAKCRDLDLQHNFNEETAGILIGR